MIELARSVHERTRHLRGTARGMLQMPTSSREEMSDPVLGYAAGTLIVLTLVVLGVGLLEYAVYFFFIKKW